jgi:hypothetical protein
MLFTVLKAMIATKNEYYYDSPFKRLEVHDKSIVPKRVLMLGTSIRKSSENGLQKLELRSN